MGTMKKIIFLFLITQLSFLLPCNAVTGSQDPVPDIKVNGSDSSVIVSSTDTITISISLSPGDQTGQMADWWILADTPMGQFSWVNPGGWTSGNIQAIQHPLLYLPAFTIFNSLLPQGDYLIKFSIDNTPDQTNDNNWFDAVTITVSDNSSNDNSTNTPANQTCADNDPGNGDTIISGPSGPGSNGADNDSPFRSLTIHPDNPDIVILGTERNGFVKSMDGGLTWNRFRKGLRHEQWGYPEIYDIAMSSANPDIIYAASVESPGPLYGNYPSTNAGVYKSVDQGQTWQRKNCGIKNARGTSVYVSPLDPDISIIAAAGGYPSFTGTDVDGKYFEGGLLKTIDGGNSWSKIIIHNDDNYNEFRTIIQPNSATNTVYTFGLNNNDLSLNVGFVKSLDGGNTWQQFAPFLINKHVSYFDVSSDGNVIYAVERDLMKIAKSSDGGKNWTELPIYSSGYALAMSPSDPDRVLYSTYNSLYLSTDGLKTSTPILENLNHPVSDIVFAPSNNDIVYAIISGYILYKSTDKGNSFNKIIDIRNDILNTIP